MDKRFLFKRSLENSLSIVVITTGVLLLPFLCGKSVDKEVWWIMGAIYLLSFIPLIRDLCRKKGLSLV